ncbi:MAG: hypothetical protein NVS2B5_29860 [Beijerinckiaceae bacterium]
MVDCDCGVRWFFPKPILRAEITSRDNASIGLGYYGKVLTILVAPELGSDGEMDDDDEGDSDLIESWTPRFRQ